MRKIVYCLIFVVIATCLYSNEATWYKNKVFYEVFVRSFYDTDGNGIGDFNGVTEKLDYIKSLGVDGIWLMPVFYSPSPHGYDIIDYFKVNPVYGTEDDLITLFKEAEKRDIKIILDLVINHTGKFHEWFKQSDLKVEPYTNFYVWAKEKPEGEWLSWTKGRKRDEWYYSSFGGGMPDLNFRNLLVREEIKKIAKYWLDKGAGGFRLDAARHIIENGPGELQKDTPETVEWWTEFSQYVKSVKPDALLVGEVWAGVEQVSTYYNGGKGLDLCFDFEGAKAIAKGSSLGSMSDFIDTVNKKKSLHSPYDFYAPFLSNHDTVRTMNIFSNNFNKAKAAAVLLLTSPGTPFIYYGEEIGMYQTATGKGDNGKRTIMQWNVSKNAGFTQGAKLRHDISDNKNPYNVQFQDKKKDSLLNLYRKLSELRKKYDGMTSEIYHFIENDAKIISFTKGSDENKLLILINQSDVIKKIEMSDYNGEYTDILTDKKYVIRGMLAMKKGEIRILSMATLKP
ncbi:MAG: hypothetical protein A2015_09865 [Spirochaetes bacterium GWF1_31_7]|nr:MAG: hypothetical protein A2Y30_07250 [Spirochaetes bacterium GWE1_32_154]OHD45657.1 MAG: hypothetical protein A2Y29_15770 [Spirochaetes bacterium GWE2_31_10]OHD48228.1 MAG: hypothetical protein A2015_09865 [Spirochaetes bacterium GWF1_31_7]OHD78330.1 MAG: hypothetical protein A2355_04565 [Spirochaetes bacterium RIFOXYB1_FULL_32_8]HBD95781.1 alpha-amylase [Spirochaetia bacterium]